MRVYTHFPVIVLADAKLREKMFQCVTTELKDTRVFFFFYMNESIHTPFPDTQVQ